MDEYVEKKPLIRKAVLCEIEGRLSYAVPVETVQSTKATNIRQIMHNHITSVAEGLPPAPGHYLCFWNGVNHPDGTWDVLSFDGEKFPWETVFPSHNNEVTHWLPLPKDHKGDKD